MIFFYVLISLDNTTATYIARRQLPLSQITPLKTALDESINFLLIKI